MFDSLVQWCRFPVYIITPTSYDAFGSPRGVSETVQAKCYKADEMRLITNKSGEEYRSYTQIYLPATVDISLQSTVKFTEGETSREIQKIDTFNDGNKGVADCVVAYL